MKRYEVIAKGVVIAGNPAAVGDIIELNPKGGEAQSGLRHKQLKAAPAAANKETDKDPNKGDQSKK